VTNYTALIQAIERWRQDRSEKMCLITFNYDTLLDRACRSVLPGFPLDSVESYVSDPRYKLIKLHGSVDWYRRVQSPDFPAGERNPYTVQRDRELVSIVPETAMEYLIDNAQRWSYVDDFRRVPSAVPPWDSFRQLQSPLQQRQTVTSSVRESTLSFWRDCYRRRHICWSLDGAASRSTSLRFGEMRRRPAAKDHVGLRT
jgi:hypothetical protein